MKKVLLTLAIITLLDAGVHSRGSWPLLFGQGVIPAGSSQPFSNQQAATGSAVALNNGTSQPLKTICVKALHANVSAVYLGGAGVTTGTGMELQADQSYCGAIANANTLFIVGTGSVSWIGTN